MKLQDKGIVLGQENWKEIADSAREKAYESDIIDNRDPEEKPYSKFDIEYKKDGHCILIKCQAFYGLDKRYGGERYGTREDRSVYVLLSVRIEDIIIDGEKIDYDEYKDNEDIKPDGL